MEAQKPEPTPEPTGQDQDVVVPDYAAEDLGPEEPEPEWYVFTREVVLPTLFFLWMLRIIVRTVRRVYRIYRFGHE